MKKILFVWDRLDSLGGVEVVIYNLSKKLIEKGYSVYLAVFKDGYVRQMFEEIGVNIKVFQRKNKVDLNPFKEFYNFVKNEKIDVIHTHGHFPGIIGRFVGRLLKKKVISTYHLALNEDGHPTITKILTKITLTFANYITFVSQKVEKSFFKDSMVFDYSLINKRNHFTIYNGVDIEEINKSLEGLDRNLIRKYYEIDKDDIFLLNIGRLTEQKGQKYLIEAMRKIVKVNKNVKLVIIGEGELKEYLEKMIDQNSLEEHIKIFPPTRDIFKVMASADVFIFPSLWEGLPVVLIEAMAIGIPIIATNVTGINEIITNNHDGILVESKNADTLADAVTDLINNKEKIKSLVLNANNTVKERFTLDRMSNYYESLYK
jgi:glycosyltransferase involved in cell wall biosynthesis